MRVWCVCVCLCTGAWWVQRDDMHVEMRYTSSGDDDSAFGETTCSKTNDTVSLLLLLAGTLKIADFGVAFDCEAVVSELAPNGGRSGEVHGVHGGACGGAADTLLLAHTKAGSTYVQDLQSAGA